MGKKYKRSFGHEERMQRKLVMKEARMLKEDDDRIESQITEDLKDIVDAQLARVNPKACCDAAEKAACVITAGQEFCVV